MIPSVTFFYYIKLQLNLCNKTDVYLIKSILIFVSLVDLPSVRQVPF